MPTSQEYRVTQEVFRLCCGMKLRLLEGVANFKLLDDAGDIDAANAALLEEAQTVIRFKNRIANAVYNSCLNIAGCIEFCGTTVADIRADLAPVVQTARQIIANTPLTRVQVDNATLPAQPYLVDDLADQDI